MDWTQIGETLAAVNWLRVVVTVAMTALAVVVGIWFPARVLERYTNQPALRYIWYVAGVLMLVMVYVSLYGYGHFWELYSASELAENSPSAG